MVMLMCIIPVNIATLCGTCKNDIFKNFIELLETFYKIFNIKIHHIVKTL